MVGPGGVGAPPQDLAGRVAFVTGAARGQGRSHARELARRGMDVVAVDVCAPIPSVPYPLATRADLDETVAAVEAAGGRCVPWVADVRDRGALDGAVRAGLERFGRLDVVVANAGVAQGLTGDASVPDEQLFADYVAIDLVGVWNTIKVCQAALVDGGRGGSIILINSTSGLKGMSRGDPRADAYTAAKHGCVGLMRAYALELGPHRVRVNSVHPTAVGTPMIDNDAMRAWVQQNVSRVSGGFGDAMGVGRIDVEDVSAAVVWLASDASRYVTGVTLPVDAGFVVT